MNWNWWPLVWRSTFEKDRWTALRIVTAKETQIAALRLQVNRLEVELADLRNAVRRMAP